MARRSTTFTVTNSQRYPELNGQEFDLSLGSIVIFNAQTHQKVAQGGSQVVTEYYETNYFGKIEQGQVPEPLIPYDLQMVKEDAAPLLYASCTREGGGLFIWLPTTFSGYPVGANPAAATAVYRNVSLRYLVDTGATLTTLPAQFTVNGVPTVVVTFGAIPANEQPNGLGGPVAGNRSAISVNIDGTSYPVTQCNVMPYIHGDQGVSGGNFGLLGLDVLGSFQVILDCKHGGIFKLAQ